jgi:hypothetical protein
MAMFDSPEELAACLMAADIDCSVSDGFVELPSDEAELTATLQLTGGWLVFKAYLGEWHPRFNDSGHLTLLRLHDRLIGLRFSLVENDLWAIQDFPVEALSDRLDIYIRNAFWLLGIVRHSLLHHLSSDRPMSEDDIDAMFERLEASHLN